MAFLSKRWSAIQHGFIMFNWIGRKPAVQAPRQAARLAFPSPAPVQRPGLEALREQLYMVVRDVMLRAEVLSPSYKFKVLSLGAQGSSFYVMIDLSRDYCGESALLGHIERAIAAQAQRQFGISVKAVYWRVNLNVATGIRPKLRPTAPGAQPSRTIAMRPAAAAPVNTIKPTGAPPASLIDRSPSGLGVTQYGEI